MDVVTALLTFLGSQGTVGFILALSTIAFTVWAIVVWKIGQSILNKLERMEHVINYLDHRLLKVETYLELRNEEFKPYRNGSGK